MEFFEKLKAKLRVRYVIWTVVYALVVCVLAWVVIITGFSADTHWKINMIPIPDFLISFSFILLGLLFCYIIFRNIRELFTNTEYKKVLEQVEKIGNADAVGEMLSSLEKDKLVKGGELRYNTQVIYYRQGTDVSVFSPLTVSNVRMEIVKVKHGEEYYVCIDYMTNVLRIQTNKKGAPLLMENLRKMMASLYAS